MRDRQKRECNIVTCCTIADMTLIKSSEYFYRKVFPIRVLQRLQGPYLSKQTVMAARVSRLTLPKVNRLTFNQLPR